MDKVKLVVSIAVPLMIGLLSGFLTDSDSLWYQELEKPFFNPPGWVFGPVWTTLYILMGIAFYLVWTSGKKIALPAYFYHVQLLLNALWSFLFFNFKMLLFAFVELVLLWLLIVLTMYYFRKISKTSFYLMIPYLVWVTFAGVLNLSLYILNI